MTMCSLSACSGFLFVSYVAVMPTLSTQMIEGPSLTNLFADHTFVDDDLCSSIISNHPCVKNILTVLVNHISDNIREMRLTKERNLETIEILVNQLSKNQEVLDTNQHEIKLLKAELKQMKINRYIETNSKVSDANFDGNLEFLHARSQNKEKLSWLNGDKKKPIIENSTLVSDFISNFFMPIRHTYRMSYLVL